jgi:hypothetical protein
MRISRILMSPTTLDESAAKPRLGQSHPRLSQIARKPCAAGILR